MGGKHLLDEYRSTCLKISNIKHLVDLDHLSSGLLHDTVLYLSGIQRRWPSIVIRCSKRPGCAHVSDGVLYTFSKPVQPCVFPPNARRCSPRRPVQTDSSNSSNRITCLAPPRLTSHSVPSTSLEHAPTPRTPKHRWTSQSHPVSDHPMVALARIISAVLLFAVSLDSHLAQVIPDIPTISRAPSPSSVPTVSPSPLISPSSSHSALPSAAPSPAESPTPSLPGVPSESVFPSSPVQTAAVASPEASEGVQGIGIAEATPPAAAAVAPAESPSPNPESSAAVAGASPAPPLASPSPVDESSSGAASEDSNESGTAGDANVSPIPSPAAPSVSQSGIGSGEVPDAADSEPEPTQLTPQPSATSSPSVPSPATTPVIGGGSSTNSPEQPEQGAQPTSKACVRDVSQPRPALGISPSRYAFSVFASAAAVAFANMLYKLAAKWETHEQHMAVRIISIVLARLCIIFSVKLSSALVAVTANSPGIDSGADVGGAYLTWASAILSSLYHESAMMTFIATGYVVQTNTWYPNLRVYLSPWYNHLRNPETDFFDLQNMEESNDSSPGDQVRSRYQALTLFERIKGGRIDRHLLILTALLYVAMELITLIISLLQLLDDLSGTSGKDSVFVDAGDSPEIARCPIRLADLAGMFAMCHDAYLFHRSMRDTDNTFSSLHYLVSLSVFWDRRCPRSLPSDKAAIFSSIAGSDQ